MKFRKRPVVVEAHQWLRDDPVAVERMQAFLGNAFFNHGGLLRVHTLEGTMEAGDGDWIIRGVKGEFYPCKNDIFLATYEPVEDV